MLELYSLQKVLWCKDRKKIENHGFKIAKKVSNGQKVSFDIFQCTTDYYKLPIHQQLMHLLYIY